MNNTIFAKWQEVSMIVVLPSIPLEESGGTASALNSDGGRLPLFPKCLEGRTSKTIDDAEVSITGRIRAYLKPDVAAS